MTMAVGGLVEDPAISYSLVETGGVSCVLSLPPLPSQLMLDPVVEMINDTILLCSLDYDLYRAGSESSAECWTLQLARRPRVWVPAEPPPRTLFLPTFTSHESKIYMFGGSQVSQRLHQQLVITIIDQELLPPDQFSLMSGTRTVQVYDVTTNSWSLPPSQLPAPLFEGCAVSTHLGIVIIGDFEAGQPNAYISRGDQWNKLPVSNYAHTNPGCSMVTIRNQTGILVISGVWAELLRLEDEKWIILPQPKIKRFRELKPTVGTSLGQIVVVGGVDRDTGEVSNVIEVWDEEAGDWSLSGGVINNRRTRQTEISVPVRYMDSCDILTEKI